MRKRRYLAPWQRVDLVEAGAGEGGSADGKAGGGPRELSAEDLLALRGKPALYHCISRVVNRDKVLGPEEKERFVQLLRLYERFCRVHVLAFCVMSNHFHLLLEVPARPEGRMSDEELLDHLALLYGKAQLKKIRWELEHYRAQGNDQAAEALKDKFFARMYDLSAFMKVVKQRFTQFFNKKHGRKGTLWEDRFKSVLVEDGHAARVVAAYIDLNPLRAGLVRDPREYRWCSYGEAVAGRAAARAGLQRVMFEQRSGVTSVDRAARETGDWRRVARAYREMLFRDGGASRGEKEGGTRKQGVRTFSEEEVAEVLRSGGRLSEGEMLRCRVRYLADGMVLGSRAFLERVFRLSRAEAGRFPATRRSGARRIRGVETELCTMRDLQVRTLS
jgi:REP element-mobilizing transposase RayT